MALTLEQIVARDTIEYYDCVAINIDATHNYYLTQAPYNLNIDGDIYIAAGGLLSITDFVDNANFSIEKLSITLAGIVSMPTGKSVLQTIQELDYVDKPITIYRAFMVDFKPEHTVVLYKGYINNLSAVLGAAGDSTQATIETSSHWTNFDRVSTRYTNSKSQQEYYPSDLGLDYCADVQKEVQWREAG